MTHDTPPSAERHADTGAREGVGRRAFLRTALFGAGAVALGSSPFVVYACARRTEPPVPLPRPFRALRDAMARSGRFGLQVFPGGQVFLRGDRLRIPVGLVDDRGAPIEGIGARAWVGQESALTGPYDVAYRVYERSLPGDPRGFHVFGASVPWTGIVDVLVQAGGLYGTTTIEAREKSPSPEPGDRAVAVATPTTGDLRGVKNLCTRLPACSMHGERLDRVLGDGKPTVFTISSPKLCSSRTCGPVVDEILALKARHGRAAHFIHAEVYRGDTPTTLSPTSLAWNLQSEPWTWVIDGKGMVRARFEGPVVAAEIEAALAPQLS